MELIFIGVGGGRMVTERQYAPFYTGGFRIHTEGLKFHIDPGPGAVLRSSQLGIKVEDTDVLIVSHNHMDHANDANIIGEAMNGFGLKKEGVFITSKNTLEDPSRNNMIIPYIRNLFKAVYIPKPDEEFSVEHKGLSFSMKTTRIDHPEPTGWGFILNIEGKRIGYTSDTLYYEGLGEPFKGVDILLANMTKIKPSVWGKHLSVYPDMEKLLEEARPKRFIMYHIGEEILFYGYEKILKEVKEKYELSYDVEISLPLSGDKMEI